MSQSDLDLSDMDDFEVIEERRRVMAALAFLTDKWLAVEVLLSDPAGLADEDLVNRLIVLQDRLEHTARIRYGVG